MQALIAALLLAPLLYLPGTLIAWAMLGAAQPPDPLERHYERVLAGALLNGWLALALAGLGVFSAWLHLLIVALVCLGCGGVVWRRGRAETRDARHETRDTEAPHYALRTTHYAFLAVLLLFAVLVARPFELVLGARDAGVYANTGIAIARTGGIVQHDALLAQIAADKGAADPQLAAAAAQAETNLLGPQPATRFVATRLRYAGFLINDGDLARGLVTPQFFHLYPAWIALLAGLLGPQGGLLATGLLGLLGLWGVGMLGRRLAGDWVGLLGMLFLALNGAQVWFSRYSTSEAGAQFLSFAALYAFAVFQEPRSARQGDARQGDTRQEDAPDNLLVSLSPCLPVSPSYSQARRAFAGLLAGLAAGQLALTRIDFFVLVAPLLAYLAYAALTRRWSRAHWWLLGGLGAMLLHAALHIIFIARAYFLDTLYARLQDQSALVAWAAYALWTPALRRQFLEIPRSAPLREPYRLPLEIALVLLLVVAFIWLRRDGRLLRAFEHTLLRYRRGLLRLAAALVLLLGIYGYLVRPQILSARTLTGCLAERAAPACLALQGYIGAPIAVPAQPNALAYALDALPRLLRGQAVPPRAEAEFSPGRPSESEKIGIAQANLVRVGWYLSPLGMLLAILGAALWWRRGLNGASWLFLLAGLVSTLFFVRLSYGTSDLTYIYILRRYIPLAYPAMSLAMAYAVLSLVEAQGGFTTKTPRYQDPHKTFAPEVSVSQAKKLGALVPWWLCIKHPIRVGLAVVVVTAQLAFFIATNRQLYRHTEYAGAFEQLGAVAGQFQPHDVLLLRGEGRDTPDLLATPLKYSFGLDTFAVRSSDPGRYAAQLAAYVRSWQAQGRRVFLVLGANGGIELPGLRAVRVGPAALRLPEFQQLREQKPSLPLEFNFDFTIYRLEDVGAAPPLPQPIEPGDFTAQLRGFYHPEQIDGATAAWTDGDALLRLPWPQGSAPLALRLRLAPGPTRPAALGPSRACISQLPAPDFALPTQPFTDDQCFELKPGMQEYAYTLNPQGTPAPASGSALRIASATWVPAETDAQQHDQRKLGVLFGGLVVTR